METKENRPFLPPRERYPQDSPVAHRRCFQIARVVEYHILA